MRDVVRGSSKGAESVHTSVGDISSDDDMSYVNVLQGRPHAICTILHILSFCTDGGELNETWNMMDIPNYYSGIIDKII